MARRSCTTTLLVCVLGALFQFLPASAHAHVATGLVGGFVSEFTRLSDCFCCEAGTLSERSNALKTFMPSMGLCHCTSASAGASAVTIANRVPSAIQRRAGLSCKSAVRVSQTIHPHAGNNSHNQCGWENWKFTLAKNWPAVPCEAIITFQ